MLDFDPKKVTGYDSLDENMKNVFERTSHRFIQAQGHEYKDERRPMKVRYLEKEKALRVDLWNGEWQYFYRNYTWG